MVVVVGTGIAINATGEAHASWLGLLKHGIRHLISNHIITPQWGHELEEGVDAAFSPFQLQKALEFAENIEQTFKMSNGKLLAPWLESAFASFKMRNEERAKAPLEALRDLHEAGALIVTTNYDSLLSDFLPGTPPVTWEEHERFLRVITRQDPGILHIHGHWQRPSSIVLGRSSYDRVVADKKFQELFKTLWLNSSWIYVGCGDGLDDPNLGRLLAWSNEWGKSSLPDYFLAQEDKAKEINARLERPLNLCCVGYPTQDDLPVVLRSVTPAARCWPFVQVDDDFPLFHVPGASDPFPTRKEYLNGDVPSFSADSEVLKRLQTHGWACCMDVASVGKTTLALRVATTHEQNGHPVFYLDLKREVEEEADASPVGAITRLARSGALLILDNIHYKPDLALALWQRWNDKPPHNRGHLLLVATRIHRAVVDSPDQDLTFFERNPKNPSIPLQPTPEDLGHLAKHLYRRVAGANAPPMPEPPTNELAEWHRIFGAALNAFTFAVLESLAEFQRGRWQLPPIRASAWVRKKWLDNLRDSQEIDNTICLAAFGAQELEILVEEAALPNSSKMEKLFQLGLVAETKRGKWNQYRMYELREPGWGQLILAALPTSVDLEQIRFDTAAKHLQIATALSARLRRRGDEARLKSLWQYIADREDEFRNQILDIPLSLSLNLIRFAKSCDQTKLVTLCWNAFENHPEKFTPKAWATSLDVVGSFLDLVKQHGRDTSLFWKLLEEDPDKFTASVWANSLDKVGSFLSVANQHGRDTNRFWALIEGSPDKFSASCWASSLEQVCSFLNVAKQQGRDTSLFWAFIEGDPDKFTTSVLASSLLGLGWFLKLAKQHTRDTNQIWMLIEGNPDKLAARISASSLETVGWFLNVAKQHGRDISQYWEFIEGDPDKITADVWATSLEKLGSFLNVAKQHGRDTSQYWELIEGDPDKITAVAWATSLEKLGSFLNVAKQHGRDTSQYWELIEGDPDKITAGVWAISLDKVGSFLSVAKQHGRDTSRIWALIEGNPDKFTANAWASTLDTLGSFLTVAQEHGRDTTLYWELIESQPKRFAERTWMTTLDGVGSFFNLAKKHGRDTGPFWQILESEPDQLSNKGLNSTLTALVAFSIHAPISILKIAIYQIRPGHWNSATDQMCLKGATWLARNSKNANRDDIASDLITLLLHRANWQDFPIQYGGFLQICWLLANVPPSAEELVESFVNSICTNSSLQNAYKQSNKLYLISGLRELAFHQSSERCRQFHHPALGLRLAIELAQFETVPPHDQSAIMQFLGCAALSGWPISQRSLSNIRISSVSQLPVSIFRHRPEAKMVEVYQLQFWLGLRAFVSISREMLLLPPETIGETLTLWRENLKETASTPLSTAHRVNQSMVTWLESCRRANPPALLPTKRSL